MKTIYPFIFVLITFFSSNLFASKTINTDMETGLAMAKMLQSDKAPLSAKSLVSAILNGQGYSNRVSVIRSDVRYALGKTFITILIGEDDLTDDDHGWGTVYQLKINLERIQNGGAYQVSEVELELLAG